MFFYIYKIRLVLLNSFAHSLILMNSTRKKVNLNLQIFQYHADMHAVYTLVDYIRDYLNFYDIRNYLKKS